MNQDESLPNWEMVYDCLKDMLTFSTNQIPHVAEQAIMEEDAKYTEIDKEIENIIKQHNEPFLEIVTELKKAGMPKGYVDRFLDRRDFQLTPEDIACRLSKRARIKRKRLLMISDLFKMPAGKGPLRVVLDDSEIEEFLNPKEE
jgi:hypothetical protein